MQGSEWQSVLNEQEQAVLVYACSLYILMALLAFYAAGMPGMHVIPVAVFLRCVSKGITV